jgi:hypothetical protein
MVSGKTALTKQCGALIALLTMLPSAASAQDLGPAAKVVPTRSRTSLEVVRPGRGVSGAVSNELLAAFQSIASQNQCVIYTYDHNGNITAKIDQPVGASPIWGSAAFGCFLWTAP